MYYRNKKGFPVFDTLIYSPTIPGRIVDTEVRAPVVIGHWKVNNSVMTGNDKDTKRITLINDDGTVKTTKEIWDIFSNWDDDTLFNAFFAENFEAGTLSGGGGEIDRLLVRRLSPYDHYKSYRTVGALPYDKDQTKYVYNDPFIESGEVYLYSIQPVTIDGHYGPIQNVVAALNEYEHIWIIDKSGVQIQALDAKISEIQHVTKDGIVETIGGRTPYVNRYSNLDYRTFSIDGTIASEFDSIDSVKDSVEKDLSHISADIRDRIQQKFIEKTGTTPQDVSNSMAHYSYEKKFRDKVVKLLKNGDPKIIKTPNEGLILAKLTNVKVTPIQELGGTLYRFSATVTEVGDVGEGLEKRFGVDQ